MQVELDEQGYTLDKKWKLVPVEPSIEMIAAIGFGGNVDIAIGHGSICQGVVDNYKSAIEISAVPDLSGIQIVKNIHVGGELLPEFKEPESIIKYKSDVKVSVWCKQCGADFINGNKHLLSCPTLKSKL